MHQNKPQRVTGIPGAGIIRRGKVWKQRKKMMREGRKLVETEGRELWEGGKR